MKNHKSVLFLIIFFIFSLRVFGNDPHFSFESRIGTLYVDDAGLDGLYNNSKIEFSNRFNYFDVKTGFYIGGIPGDISIRNIDQQVELNDVLYFGGFLDFGVILPAQFSLDIKMCAGVMNSDNGYLAIIPGAIAAPVYGGIQTCLNLPLDFYITTAAYGTDLSVKNDNNDSMGDGSVFCFSFNGGKKWNFQKKYSHFLSADAGYVYAGGSCNITAYDELDKTMLFPYSFMYASAASSLSFITLGGQYRLKADKITFYTDMFAMINVLSKIDYVYKATYKNNIIYDGSIVKGNDIISFSNADFLIFLNAQLSYSFRTDLINAEIFARKDFIIPYISKKTQNCFIDDSSSSDNSFSDSLDIKELLKTILLSGVSLGARIEL